jgi:tetratricopeptide (TPR) repeat protein
MAVQKKDFFISYNKADRQWAEWVAWQLEEQGYTTIVQAWDFRPGSNFVLEMQKATGEASRTIAILSPDYLVAENTQPEWAAAFAKDPTGQDRTFVPVRVRECTLAGMLVPIVHINLVGVNDETHARQLLLDGILRGRAKPTSPPTFPGGATRTVLEKPRFPGALPSIWNVPHSRNPNFTGREESLTGLRQALASGQAATVTLAISGLGGVGKTQLATEYVYRYSSEYDLVWWVPAEEPAALSAAYGALAQELDMPEKDAAEQSAMVEGVKRHLARRGDWLLVFDNAPGPEQVQNYLPGSTTGHILITSQNPVWGSLARRLSVDPFQRAESVEFFGQRTGQKDEEAANNLAEALGDLPLALEQAGAYIEETGTTLAAYLGLFRDRRRELWVEEHPPLGYRETIATTWEISLQQLPPAAMALMELCAFLSPDNIPRDLLEKEGTLPPSQEGTLANSLVLNRAIAALRRFSLIEVRGNTWSVHRLVQAVVQDRLPYEEKKAWAGSAVVLVTESYPSGDISANPSSWPACARLLPHALMAAGHAEALEAAPKATGWLLNEVGLYLKSRAEFTLARDHLQRALALGEQAYGPDDPEVAVRLSHLGNVFRELANLPAAWEHLQRALSIDEKAYGPNDPIVAHDLNDLGIVLLDLGDLAGAWEHFQRALAIDEEAYVQVHPTVATDLNGLGTVLRDLGDPSGAREYYQRALTIDEQIYGADHPKVAIRLCNLGLVLKDLGDLAMARKHLERALAIDEQTYGPDHPEVATDLNSLGTVLEDLGDLSGARGCYQRALRIRINRLGPDHPSTVQARNNLELLGPP